MKDIAKQAGVSLTTVSLVLNNKEARISRETRQKIKEIAEDLHYQPNTAAVTLSRKVSYSIGLIVPDITNPFFSQMTREINEILRDRGYSTLFADSNNSASQERVLLNQMGAHGVDGILLIPSNEFFSQSLKDLKTQIRELNRPMILVNAAANGLALPSVNFDNEYGSVLAAQELISNGHKKIAFIRGKKQFINAQERFDGYLRALNDNGIEYDPRMVYEGNYSIESGYAIAESLFSRQDVTAILSSSDIMLFGIIKWANERGLNAFKRFSMVGFDNDPYDVITQRPLTTVDQNLAEMVSSSVELLMGHISGKEKNPRQVLVAPRLIRRRSVRQAKLQ